MILTYKYLTQRLKTENGTLMKLVTTIQHDFFPINSTVTKKLLTSQEFGRNCTEEGQKLLLMYLRTKRTEQIICVVLSSPDVSEKVESDTILPILPPQISV